uniref:Uncharacterized protein n=1 Tax=Ditylenchus dipsaci TaxID=166011 RepID=A0A915DK16_9BILA
MQVTDDSLQVRSLCLIAPQFPSSVLIISKDVASGAACRCCYRLSRFYQECGCQGRCWTDRPRREVSTLAQLSPVAETPEPVLLPLLLRYRWG